MSVPLTSIDCPRLTHDCLQTLAERYSIRTVNEFALWLTSDTDRQNDILSPSTIACIQSCLIVHTGQILPRAAVHARSYRVDDLFVDQTDLLKSNRHLLFIYECFTQQQWNQFFNLLLIRLFLANQSCRIQYLNSNASLFDVHHFYDHYCSLNEQLRDQRDRLFQRTFFFRPYVDLETLENELDALETNVNQQSIDILIIDDVLALINPYLGLDRRVREKVMQLTYRLNRLARTRSILIITGLCLHRKQRLDSFHADRYVLFQSLPGSRMAIQMTVVGQLNSNLQPVRSILDLEQWMSVSAIQTKCLCD